MHNVRPLFIPIDSTNILCSIILNSNIISNKINLYPFWNESDYHYIIIYMNPISETTLFEENKQDNGTIIISISLLYRELWSKYNHEE